MTKKIEIKEGEMLEALNRSGYLLESEISTILYKLGFFVESNQVIEDPISGKSREIDLIAEFYNYNKDRIGNKTASKIKFVFEIKNNLFPIVLLTKFKSSPNIEEWIGLKEALTKPKFLLYEPFESYYDKLILNQESIFTQYCSFQKKKANEDLMALHPDNIHDGLSKITQYCEEMVKLYDEELIYEKRNKENSADVYFKHFLYMPILLINDDLFELHDDRLIRVDSSILVFNYYFQKEPKMAFIFVVTKKGFHPFISKMTELEDDVEIKMINIIKGKR